MITRIMEAINWFGAGSAALGVALVIAVITAKTLSWIAKERASCRTLVEVAAQVVAGGYVLRRRRSEVVIIYRPEPGHLDRASDSFPRRRSTCGPELHSALSDRIR